MDYQAIEIENSLSNNNNNQGTQQQQQQASPADVAAVTKQVIESPYRILEDLTTKIKQFDSKKQPTTPLPSVPPTVIETSSVNSNTVDLYSPIRVSTNNDLSIVNGNRNAIKQEVSKQDMKKIIDSIVEDDKIHSSTEIIVNRGNTIYHIQMNKNATIGELKEQITKEVSNVISAIIHRFLLYLNFHFFIIILFYLMIMKLSVEFYLTQLYKLLNQILSMKLLSYQNQYQIL